MDTVLERCLLGPLVDRLSVDFISRVEERHNGLDRLFVANKRITL